MSDTHEQLTVMRAQMRNLLAEWQTNGDTAAAKCLREQMRGGAESDGAPYGDYTDDELAAAIKQAAETVDGDSDEAKAEVALKELCGFQTELQRRWFPHGVEYTPPVVRRVDEIDATPPTVLLRTAGEYKTAVLTVGEVCVLSGAGGAGKSTLALAVSYAMAAGGKRDWESCGLEIRDDRDAPEPMPVVYASAEDAAWQIKRAARRIMKHREEFDLPYFLHHMDLRGRLLFAPADDGYNAPAETTPEWKSLWNAVKSTGAKMVVIDPVMAVYAGNENRAVEVRRFIGALTAEAEAHACGVLLLAHNTKAARGKDADPFDAGHVAGSASWTDGVRGALALDWPSGGEGDTDVRRLKVIKANYGQPRIECDLSPARENEAEGKRAIVEFDAGAWRAGGAVKANGDGRRGRRDNDGRPETPAEVA